MAWLLGIAALLLKKRRRDEVKDRRCASATLLGEEAWAKALERRCSDPADVAAADHLDIEQALSRLSPTEQRAIKLRYYEGLDGKELASGLGVTTLGAARVRVCRALESLRKQFSPTEGERFIGAFGLPGQRWVHPFTVPDVPSAPASYIFNP